MVKFLLILLIISLVFRFVLPVILRLLVGRFVQKQARRYGQQFGGGASPFEGAFGGRPAAPTPPPAGGNVRVDFVPPKQDKGTPRDFKGGEYVDFEEVK
ncbi:DUF4834 domain-containing protein [Hymenobacter chitinivorans]|uniref:DUF4834 family protein n=1 Tax=Hymenobacter chitinivorans DSM 11115 TaxID=1121954 RepID=A0A2M9ASM2_9BACT|nr:DUF4834 domain-containing protein [Hymenobacter chitinivorans]PJJ48677.1 hypothetical protein CLV45_4387 [Hymenobacter chitinivorans DSM 11115]